MWLSQIRHPGRQAASWTEGLCYHRKTSQDQLGSSPRLYDVDGAVSVGCLIKPSYLGGELCSW